MSEIHVNRSRVDAARVEILDCPTCEKKRPFWRWFQEWYGWHDTCLNCGESWQDGEMLPRPFAPRWRRDSVDGAVRHMSRLLAAYIPRDPAREEGRR